MKKLFIILLSALSLTVVAQEKKTVAVLNPICRDNSVNAFYQQMVRGAMESAVTASEEYEAYDRSAFDMIQQEQAFQRTGAVNDSQILKMGEMAGVDYVLVPEVSAYDGYMSTIVKILNVTTGKYDKSVDDYTQLNPEDVKKKCSEMASSLFGNKSQTVSHIKPTEAEERRQLELLFKDSKQGWNLAGRSVISLPKPSNDFKEEGKVVVAIIVDAGGKVISAKATEGTTVTDDRTIQLALKAAYKAVFSKTDSPNKQFGTITYVFKFN